MTTLSTTPDKTEQLLAAFRAKCRADFWAFARVCLPHYMRVDPAPFHREIARWLQGREKPYRAIVAPREHAKSTLVSIMYPLWATLTGRERFVVLLSASEQMATNFIASIKTEIESNELIQAVFGDCKGPVWQADDIELANGARIMARGITSSIRGLRHGADRPTLVIGDDLETDESAASRESTRKIEAKVERVLMSLGRDCCVVIVGTLLASTCVLASLAGPEKPAWESVVYRALSDKGDALWPAWWPVERLVARREAIGPVAWATEWQNDPRGEGLTPFEWSWIEAAMMDPISYPHMQAVGQALDPSSGEGTDNASHWTIGIGDDNRIYVLDHVVGKLDAGALVEMLFERAGQRYGNGRQPVDAIWIETNAFKWLEQHLRYRLQVPPIPVIQSKAKGFRIRSLIPWLSRGRVVFPRSAPWLADFRAELEWWRDTDNVRDDQLDSLQLAVSQMAQMYGLGYEYRPAAQAEDYQYGHHVAVG